MGFAAKMIITLIARFKSLGFLEWAGIASLVDTILTYDVKQQMFQLVCEYAAKGAGLQLDENDPFSDASMSGAVSQRLGFPIRSLKNQETIKEDLGNAAALIASEKSGYRIRSLTDVQVLKQDLERVGCALLTARLGIPAGVLPGEGEDIDPAVIKERLLIWAKAELTAEMHQEIRFGANEVQAAGYDRIKQVVATINAGLDDGEITERQLAVMLANGIASKAVVEYQKMAVSAGKRSRRLEQMRQAQAKFRRAHGSRQKYIPLGMTAVID